MVNITLNKFYTIRDRYSSNISTLINYLFILYAFSIPISGKMTNLLFTIILILWIIEGNLKEKFLYAFKNKFVQALLLFFAIHILWLWSSEDIVYALGTIKSIQFLIYPIIYITAIKKEFLFKILNGFIYAMMFSEIISYLISFEIIAPINNATIHDPVPFALSHTTYALYLGLSIGLMLFMSVNKQLSKSSQGIYFLFFITASANIFLIASRLGFLLYLTSIMIIFLYHFRKNIYKILLPFIFLCTIGYTAAYNLSPTFYTKVTQTITNTQKLIQDKNFGTSLGIRAGHWYYSIKLIQENFIFGVGDGDQITEFRRIITLEKDPHKNLLSRCVQNGIHAELMDVFVTFGLIGFLIYLNIYYQLYALKPKNDLFTSLKFLLLIIFLLSAVQGGAIILAVKDLGKLFTLLSILIVINSLKDHRLFKSKASGPSTSL